MISTAGDAALTVADPSASAPGRLVNGTFALTDPVEATANAGIFAPVTGAGSPLLAWNAPISNAAVALAFRQHIGANEALRTGTYAKTLTFTLSTTTPYAPHPPRCARRAAPRHLPAAAPRAPAGEQARARRLHVFAQRQAPGLALRHHALGVRVAAAPIVALGLDQHVRAERGEELVAERAAIGGRLEVLGRPDRPPSRRVGHPVMVRDKQPGVAHPLRLARRELRVATSRRSSPCSCGSGPGRAPGTCPCPPGSRTSACVSGGVSST